MTTAFENFAIENSVPSSRLELLAKEVPDQSLDIQRLDRPIVLDLKNNQENIVFGEDAENQYTLNDLEEGTQDATNYEAKETVPSRTIICRNESLEGDIHPITGVPFERKEVDVNGEKVEGVFPQFESVCTVELPNELHQASNKEQFSHANEKLREAVASDPELSSTFTDEQLEQIENGDRPDGYVWHHAENPGELQLVNREIHDSTGHTGGQAVWGGGSQNR